MKGLSISGGGSKFGQLASASMQVIKSGYRPDVISGVSAGAVISVPLALGLFDELKYFALNLSRSDFFDVSPINDKGNISLRGIFRALTGRSSFGVQNVSKTIKKIVTREKFEEYKNGNFADCYVLAVSPEDGSRAFWNLKKCSYEGYLQRVSASSRIPIMTQPQNIEGKYYFDGGLRDHSPGAKTIEAIEGLKELICIYSRPKDFKTKTKDWNKNVLSVIERTLEIYNIETSKNDEQKEIFLCKEKGIKLDQIFVSDILSNFYDDNKERLSEAYEDGILSALKILKKE